jgi:hypothetical protein
VPGPVALANAALQRFFMKPRRVAKHAASILGQ